MHIKPLVYRALFAVLLLLELCILAECGVRVIYPQPTPSTIASRETPLVAHPLLPYAWRPATTIETPAEDGTFGTARINRDGWRGEDWAPKGDRLRVAMVGDSFTFGYGLNDGDTYPEEVARCTGYEVLNFGVLATSVDSYYVIMDQILPTYDPDIVIVTSYLGNDLRDLTRTSWPVVTTDGLPRVVRDRLARIYGGNAVPMLSEIPYRAPLLRHSHALHLVYRIVNAGYHDPRADADAYDWLLDGIRDLAARRGWQLLLVTIEDAGYRHPVYDAQVIPALGEAYLFAPEGHWNPAGARAAGQMVCGWLES